MRSLVVGAAVSLAALLGAACTDRPEDVVSPPGSDVIDIATGGSAELLDGDVTVTVEDLTDKDGDDAAEITVEAGREDDSFVGARGDRLTVGDYELVVLDVDRDEDLTTVAVAET
jgi:hypothetical protein